MTSKLDIKLYNKRREHSMKEHAYERYTTYFLIFAIILMLIGIFLKAEIIIFYVIFPIVLIATLFRLLAWYHHNKEKKLYKILNGNKK